MVKCFDVVSAVAEEATKLFAPIWILNTEKYSEFEQVCEKIDILIKEFECTSLEVEVDEIKMTISISLECESITIKTKGNWFYDIIPNAVALKFTCINDNSMKAEIVFPSVWKRFNK